MPGTLSTKPAGVYSPKPGASRNMTGEFDERTELAERTTALLGSPLVLGDPNEGIKVKKLLNYIMNGGAAALNFLHFVNSNWTFSEFLKDKLGFASSLMTRSAVLTQGGLLLNEMWNTRNLIPLIATMGEFPVALFSDDSDIWFNRGGTQGGSQFYLMLCKRHIKDDNGKTIYNAEGKPVCMSANFKTGDSLVDITSDFIQSVKVTFSESAKIVSELIQNPRNFIEHFSHAIFVASTGQIAGTALGLIGKIWGLPIVTTIGALWRDIKGTFVDFALTRDDEHKKRNFDQNGNIVKSKLEFLNMDFSSVAVWAGLTWVLAAVVDAYKRIPFLAAGIEALTNLSLTSDRFASMLFTHANLTQQLEKLNKERNLLAGYGGLLQMAAAATRES